MWIEWGDFVYFYLVEINCEWISKLVFVRYFRRFWVERGYENDVELLLDVFIKEI